MKVAGLEFAGDFVGVLPTQNGYEMYKGKKPRNRNGNQPVLVKGKYENVPYEAWTNDGQPARVDSVETDKETPASSPKLKTNVIGITRHGNKFWKVRPNTTFLGIELSFADALALLCNPDHGRGITLWRKALRRRYAQPFARGHPHGFDRTLTTRRCHPGRGRRKEGICIFK